MAADDDGETAGEGTASDGASAPDRNPDLDEALGEIEEVESRRRRWGIAIGTAVFLLLGAAIFAIVRFRTTLFRPRVDLDTERETIQKTDDPECREMIGDVTGIKHEFFSLEDEIASTMPDGDRTELRSLVSELEKLQRRIDEAEALGDEATLRFDDSRQELDDWFDYVDYEIGIVVQIAETRIEQKSSSEGNDADAGGGSEETGTPGMDAGSRAGRSDEGDAGGANLARERKEAVAAVHRAFENFRVWHEGGRHPCAAADPDETPWRPDDWGDAGLSDGGVTDEEER